jgi:hypothetical protein
MAEPREVDIDSLDRTITQILQGDPVCNGRVAASSIQAIARLLVMPERPAGPDLPDVLAYLQRRHANAATIVSRSPEFAEQARDRQRQLEVMIDELRAGLHHGCAEVTAALSNDGDENGPQGE